MLKVFVSESCYLSPGSQVCPSLPSQAPSPTSSRLRAGRWHLSSSSSARSFKALLWWTSRFLLSRSLCRVARSSSSSLLSCSCSSRASKPRYFSNSNLKRCLCVSTFSWSDTVHQMISSWGRAFGFNLHRWDDEAGEGNVWRDLIFITLWMDPLHFNNTQKPETTHEKWPARVFKLRVWEILLDLGSHFHGLEDKALSYSSFSTICKMGEKKGLGIRIKYQTVEHSD